jgi:hypothetical protein
MLLQKNLRKIPLQKRFIQKMPLPQWFLLEYLSGGSGIFPMFLLQ